MAEKKSASQIQINEGQTKGNTRTISSSGRQAPPPPPPKPKKTK